METKDLAIYNSNFFQKEIPFFFNREMDKGELKRFIAWHLKNRGKIKTLKMIDQLKTLGFYHATKAGLSLGLEDLKIPPAKKILIGNAEIEMKETDEKFFKGEVTAVERSQKILDVWNAASELLKDEVVEYFRQTDLLNPVYMMAFSGARGNLSQVRQLVGMRGLMADPQGEIIDLPIKSNFREGLTVTEYIISCYGARKGLVDTALKTANSGYLTRRLVDVAQSVIIKEIDCTTRHGITISPLVKERKVLLPLKRRLVGRVLANSIRTKNKWIGLRNEDISEQLAIQLDQEKKKVLVRSPLTCQTVRHICKLCYGWSLAQGSMVDLGEAIGIIAAQSIGEPGTQLTMRTFHTGGVFSTGVADRIYAPHNGRLEYWPKTVSQTTRTVFGQSAIFFEEELDLFIIKPIRFWSFEKKPLVAWFNAWLIEGYYFFSISFLVTILFVPFLFVAIYQDYEQENDNQTKISIPPYTLIYPNSGTTVEWKQVIAETSDLKTILIGPKNQGVRTYKEVCSFISGQVSFEKVTAVTLFPKTEVIKKRDKKISLKPQIHFYERSDLSGKNPFFIKRNLDFKMKVVFSKGDAFISILQGKVIPFSSFNLPLSQKGDFLVKHQEEILPKERIYSFSLIPTSKGFLVPNKYFKFCWISPNLQSKQNTEFNIYFKPWKQIEKSKEKHDLFTTSKLDALKKSINFHFRLKAIKKVRKKYNSYCFPEYSLYPTTENWFYIPNILHLPKSKKQLKKIFQKNIFPLKPFELIIDGIQFNDSIFLEWNLIISPQTSKSYFCIHFQKQTPLSFFNCEQLDEKDSIHSQYTILSNTPFTRSNKIETKDWNSNELEKKQELEIKLKNQEEKKYCLFPNEDYIKYNLKEKKSLVKFSNFLLKGDQLAKNIQSSECGVVSQITKNHILLRKGTPFRASDKSKISVSHNSLVYEGGALFNLLYKKAKSEDIVQGLPKIEELFEARRTKNLRPIQNNSHEKLQKLFEEYKEIWGLEIASRMSLKDIQKFLVDSVQHVYQSQGVDISDKHVEIIVKQMTSRVSVIHGGQTSLLYGELVEFHQLHLINDHMLSLGRQKATYEPIILGITKASLTTQSFLSAASFQETTKVLTQAAIQGKIDLFYGLKENVLIGQLIPAGTGFLNRSS
uniref:DNA-directed RNA polymerase subunit beta'' n=1 Tax=Pyramimonas parkeae TaxID=36894 RepID=C0JX50_9CHLO|nr:beta' subunit of RNA polymerase [Pyramimonas parkeae]ACJ71128.1 beta' subunit of RNA polymerase [Pyramimonas parkeae]